MAWQPPLPRETRTRIPPPAAGIPTGKFRGLARQMAANAGLAVIAVDPAYTSRWGAGHWLARSGSRTRSPPAIMRPRW